MVFLWVGNIGFGVNGDGFLFCCLVFLSYDFFFWKWGINFGFIEKLGGLNIIMCVR